MPPDISKCPWGWGQNLSWSRTICLRGLFGELYVNSNAPCLDSLTGEASGICILASFSVDSDAGASWTTKKHFSFLRILFGGYYVLAAQVHEWYCISHYAHSWRLVLALPLNAPSTGLGSVFRYRDPPEAWSLLWETAPLERRAVLSVGCPLRLIYSAKVYLLGL